MATRASVVRSLNATQGITAQNTANTITPGLDIGNLSGSPINYNFGTPDLYNNLMKSPGDPIGFKNPSTARLDAAGLNAGGATSAYIPGTTGINFSSSTGSNEKDWRIRISLANQISTLFSGSSDIQAALNETNGVIFPYTPAISVQHNARYSEAPLMHSNYKSYFYEGSDVAAITISGEFSVQNVNEGKYLLAAIYFFRAVTKMFVGQDKDPLSGNPPPLVFLDGYGDFYFPHVSCVVMNFTHTMPGDVDYIPIPVTTGVKPQQVASYSNQIVRLPTLSTISVTVQPIYSRENIFNNFSLVDFAQGKLLKGFI